MHLPISEDLNQFYEASISTCDQIPQNFACGREIVFAVAPSDLDRVASTDVQFYLTCDASVSTVLDFIFTDKLVLSHSLIGIVS